MLKTIVVATDFSELADAAIDRRAGASDGTLCGAHGERFGGSGVRHAELTGALHGTVRYQFSHENKFAHVTWSRDRSVEDSSSRDGNSSAQTEALSSRIQFRDIDCWHSYCPSNWRVVTKGTSPSATRPGSDLKGRTKCRSKTS